MFQNTDEKLKIVSIWLTRKEAEDNKMRESLKPIYKENKKKGYMTVVFESGDDEDLVGLTSALIGHNRLELYEKGDISHKKDLKSTG